MNDHEQKAMLSSVTRVYADGGAYLPTSFPDNTDADNETGCLD